MGGGYPRKVLAGLRRCASCTSARFADRLAEWRRKPTRPPRRSTTRNCWPIRRSDVVIIATTPETTHYPFTKEALLAGKHVFVEKPLASTTEEADELIALARERNLKLTVGYSQRFSPRMAYIRKTIQSGAIGDVVTCLVSRNVTRELGQKITGRVRLSPAAMEATHDLDYLMWCLAPRKPVRVYSQTSGKLFPATIGSPDHQWIMVTLDDGITLTVGAGWILPLGYPNYSQCWIEVIGTEGALSIDDSHRK